MNRNENIWNIPEIKYNDINNEDLDYKLKHNILYTNNIICKFISAFSKNAQSVKERQKLCFRNEANIQNFLKDYGL